MMTTEVNLRPERNDAELVAESLSGSRDAFRRIVERYQTLICSLAYSATGNLSRSEDVAQETFIAAWTNLRALREPAKLRGWLCGIARNLIQRSLRQDGREPAHLAAPLEDAHDSPALDALPSEEAISREEEAILWRSLEKIPETYREPLVLFYREHQSIERVAAELELSADAVKQRLARGRKLLQEEVQAFVESALRRTAPSQAFASAVLSTLPMAGPATAGMGVGAKGAAGAKSGFLGWLALLTPFLGIAAIFGAQCLAIRAATTDRRQRTMLTAKAFLCWVAVAGLAWGGELAIRLTADRLAWGTQARFATLAVFWFGYCCALIAVFNAGRNPVFSVVAQSPGGGSNSLARPMGAVTLAVFLAGIHGGLVFVLIRVAWNAHDPLGAWTLAGAALASSVVAFVRLWGKTGAELARGIGAHIFLCLGMLLAAVNLRIDVWAASAYGVTVAEARRMVPMWIVPVLTLAFLAWVGAVMAATRRMAGRDTNCTN